jgi:hypothetical protein
MEAGVGSTLVEQTETALGYADAGRPESFDRFATAQPDAALAQELSRLTNELLCGWLEASLENCEQALGLDLSRFRHHIAQLPLHRPAHPFWHALSHHLEAGIDAQDPELVLDWLAALQRWIDRPSGARTPYVASILAEGWEAANVARMRAYDQLDIRGDGTLIWPLLDPAEIEFHRQNIAEAMDLIRLHDPELGSEFDAFVVCIRLFTGRVLRGETSPATFGAVWLRVPEPQQDQVAYWLEHLTHEVSHLRLEALFMQERLVLNPYEERRFRAPIRDDPRPMRGVFHATFVLARIVRLFRRLSIVGMDKRLRDMLRLFELQFEIGIATLNSSDAKFSKNGAAIRDALPACCTS